MSDYEYQSLRMRDDKKASSVKIPTPKDFFAMASYNSMAQGWVQLWRQGDVNWEQMLMGVALSLAEQNKTFIDNAMATWKREVTTNKEKSNG